ncbi:MAG: IS3 family transposase, partial [Phascolarctobacterium sp.]|nr:IS3 family transposase [Phascolarctobacterium sp.]
MDKAAAKYKIIDEVLSAEDNVLNTCLLCSIAGVSRQGYYYWLKTRDVRQEREEQDIKDFELVLEAYNFRGYAKGARGIHMRLLHLDTPVLMNHKKITRLMRKYGLECPIRQANPYRRTGKSFATDNTAENVLNREFRKHGARKVLLTDITYIPFKGSFCYLSTILDAYTKQILSYVFSESLELDFVLETVEIAMKKHR